MAIPIVEAFWKPQEAIEEIKKERNLSVPIVYLIIAGILTAISFALLGYSAGGTVSSEGRPLAQLLNNPGIAAVGGFLIVLIGGLLGGLYYMLVMGALKTKSDYFAGVATLAHTAMPASLGLLIVSILSLIPKAGPIIGAIIGLVFFALSAGTLYNATREFFETDMITALVGVTAFSLSISMVVLAAAFPQLPNLLSKVTSSQPPAAP
ncbi:MAG TPA: YIP1 family protein [Thermoplasmatales archaeon]|nr:YIP1 family protein [Thermoplasmatales archaeon]HEX17157.1 YIP1 family protein [Thermoplasmatales archaeon]